MIISTDTTNKNDVLETIRILEIVLSTNVSTDDKPKKEKPKKTKKVEPEPDLEIEDDDEDPFDDDEEKEYTEADVKKALTEFAKENDKKAAKKILKQYSPSGKLSDVDSDDYANLIADLV